LIEFRQLHQQLKWLNMLLLLLLLPQHHQSLLLHQHFQFLFCLQFLQLKSLMNLKPYYLQLLRY
jgi:hypothetical protein